MREVSRGGLWPPAGQRWAGPAKPGAASGDGCLADHAAEPIVVGVVGVSDEVATDHPGLLTVGRVVGAVEREIAKGPCGASAICSSLRVGRTRGVEDVDAELVTRPAAGCVGVQSAQLGD